MTTKKDFHNFEMILKGIEERNDDSTILVRDTLKAVMKSIAKDYPNGELLFTKEDAPQCVLQTSNKEIYHDARIMKMCFGEDGTIGIMFVYDDVEQKQTLTNFDHLIGWEENFLYGIIHKLRVEE